MNFFIKSNDLLDIFFYATVTLVVGLGARYFVYYHAEKVASKAVEKTKTGLWEGHCKRLEKNSADPVSYNKTLQNSNVDDSYSAVPTPEILNSLCTNDEQCSILQNILTGFRDALPLVEHQFFMSLQLAGICLFAHRSFYPAINCSAPVRDSSGPNMENLAFLKKQKSFLEKEKNDAIYKAYLTQNRVAERFQDLSKQLSEVVHQAHINTLQSMYGDRNLTEIADKIKNNADQETSDDFTAFSHVKDRANSILKHYEKNVFGLEGDICTEKVEVHRDPTTLDREEDYR